ncbi:MAG: 6-carboxytetrahydropterin synthase [Myxococcales bacterium]|nr:6-carboxytetrahydropterin synthase [Myxococcota bacterium]MDW8280398.1 6-carboxytetrahydropterin synthase [Myxococcales bacterium]
MPPKAQVVLTRVFRFSASHRYHDPALSEEENRRLFGACANPYGHGHNYRLEISVCGPVEPRTGMLCDLPSLEELVRREVLDRYDHRHLSHEVDDFRGSQPTTEQIALAVWQRLDGRLGQVRLHRVRVWESDELYAEVCRGEEQAPGAPISSGQKSPAPPSAAS